MGLDMYLYKRRYVKNWEHNKGVNEWTITVKHNGKLLKDPMPIAYIEYDAGYWRKANQIHKWFIDNCAGGDGDRTEMYVSHSQLKELRDLCKQVLAVAKTKEGKVVNGQHYDKETDSWVNNYEDGITITNPEEVAELLPTEDGFFFGSTEYDQWYLQDIKDTIEILDKCLVDEDCEFTYHASW